MGSRGHSLPDGGFTIKEWKSTGLLYGTKVLERVDTSSRTGLPGMSNTPGTAYVAVNKEGNFHQFRQYGPDRNPLFDIDYGMDTPLLGRERGIHIHEYVDGVRQPGRLLTEEEMAKYKKFFVGIEE